MKKTYLSLLLSLFRPPHILRRINLPRRLLVPPLDHRPSPSPQRTANTLLHHLLHAALRRPLLGIAVRVRIRPRTTTLRTRTQVSTFGCNLLAFSRNLLLAVRLLFRTGFARFFDWTAAGFPHRGYGQSQTVHLSARHRKLGRGTSRRRFLTGT